MPANRRVGSHEEPVEFRPLPGQEDDWAGYTYVPRDRIWDWMGTYPVALSFILLLVLLGMVFSER
jgi:hypothetical protein